eukprot:gene5874-1049_t
MLTYLAVACLLLLQGRGLLPPPRPPVRWWNSSIPFTRTAFSPDGPINGNGDMGTVLQAHGDTAFLHINANQVWGIDSRHIYPPSKGGICTDWDADCKSCVVATDQRAVWASPCLFLSGPAESNHTCVPQKWWQEYSHRYPQAHPCPNCSDCSQHHHGQDPKHAP